MYLFLTLLGGCGSGVLIYRYVVLGLSWSGEYDWLFTGLGVGGIFAGAQVSRNTDAIKLPIIARLAIALLGAGVAMGLLTLIVPPLSRTALARRDLPGFSIELPKASANSESIAYEAGKLMFKQVANVNAILSLTWEQGSTDLKTAVAVLAKEAGGGGHWSQSTLTGPEGKPVDTVTIETEKGTPLRWSMLRCGKRSIYLTSMGSSGIEVVHARILRTFQCTPDPAKEAAPPGQVGFVLDLPGWFATERLPTRVTLSNGKAFLMIRDHLPKVDQAELRDLLPKLFGAGGGEMVIEAGGEDRLRFSGTLQAAKMWGWAKMVECSGNNLLVVSMGANREQADSTVPLVAAGHCLRAGESPQVWPDAGSAAKQ